MAPAGIERQGVLAPGVDEGRGARLVRPLLAARSSPMRALRITGPFVTVVEVTPVGNFAMVSTATGVPDAKPTFCR